MSVSMIIALMIVVCVLLVLFFFNAKAFKAIGKLCLRGALGGVGVFAVNALLALVGIATGVGVNVFTVLFTALLGIPGFLTVYAAQMLLPK